MFHIDVEANGEAIVRHARIQRFRGRDLHLIDHRGAGQRAPRRFAAGSVQHRIGNNPNSRMGQARFEDFGEVAHPVSVLWIRVMMRLEVYALQVRGRSARLIGLSKRQVVRRFAFKYQEGA